MTFIEDRIDADMSMSDLENAVLLFDKRACFSQSTFCAVEDCSDAQSSLKGSCAIHFVKYEIRNGK